MKFLIKATKNRDIRERLLKFVVRYVIDGQPEYLPEFIGNVATLLAADFETEVTINVRGIGTVTAAPGLEAKTEGSAP